MTPGLKNMKSKKERTQPGLKRLLLIFLLLGQYACDDDGGGSTKTVLIEPVPKPAPKETPILPPQPEPVDTTPKEPPKRPPLAFFNAFPPGSVSINEGEKFALGLKADAGAKYFGQCPYDCPENLVVNQDSGEVLFSPSYEDAGIYEIEFVAMDPEGVQVISPMITVYVLNVNRAPEIKSVTMVTSGTDPTRGLRPTQLSCVIDGGDLDGGVLTFSRQWFLNDIEQSFSGLSLDLRTLSANDRIKCIAVLTDLDGLKSERRESLVFEIPNAKPVIAGTVVVNAATESSLFVIGDAVKCLTTVSDPDGDAVTLLQTRIFNKTKNQLLKDNFPYAASDSYTLTSQDGHSELFCSAEATDGAETVYLEGAVSPILNSPPRIVSLSFAKSTGGSSGAGIISGDSVVCQAEFSDPDRDSMSPVIGFYVGGVFRGYGVSLSSTEARRRYTLVTYQQTANPTNADTREKTIECRVTVSDFYGAIAQQTSSPFIIGDAPPVLTHAGGGTLSQSLVTGASLTPVRFATHDPDGDSLSIIKTADSCAVFGQGFVTVSSASSEIRSETVPGASYPQSARQCQVTIKAAASGAESSEITVSMSSPNRAPVLSCGGLVNGVPSNEGSLIVRYLEKGSADMFGRLLSSGQAIGRTSLQTDDPAKKIICIVTDPDGVGGSQLTPPGGLTGDGFQFTMTRSAGSACEHVFFPEGRNASEEIGLTGYNSSGKEVVGKLGERACRVQVYANDGGSDSNVVTVDMLPAIEVETIDAPTSTQDCRISQTTSLPKLATGGTPALQVSSTLKASVNGTDVLGLTRLGPTEFMHDIIYQRLEDNFSTLGFLSEFTVSAEENSVRTGFTKAQIYKSKQSALYNIVKSSHSGLLSVFQETPTIQGVGGNGRQGAQSKACLVKSECTGRRSSLAMGLGHTCYLTESSEVRCQGANDFQQSGSLKSDEEYFTVPRAVVSATGTLLTRVETVKSGNEHSCALVKASDQAVSGGVYCWGRGTYGQLGRVVPSQSSTPVPPPLGLADIVYAEITQAGDPVALDGVISIASGAYHTCALKLDGKILCWGRTDKAQTGTSPLSPNAGILIVSGAEVLPMPREVEASAGTPALADSIWAGGDVTCYREKGSPAVKCFGLLLKGQTGSTTTQPGGAVDYSLPVPMLLSGIDAAQVVIGRSGGFAERIGTSCVLSRLGALRCFGQGGSGQLGTSSSYTDSTYQTFYPNPDPLYRAASAAAAVAVGDKSMCRLDENGRVYCVGDNTFGQLGQGVSAGGSSLSFVEISGQDGTTLESVVAIDGYGGRFCAVDLDGLVHCWGKGMVGIVKLNESQQKAGVQNCTKEFTFVKESL